MVGARGMTRHEQQAAREPVGRQAPLHARQGALLVRMRAARHEEGPAAAVAEERSRTLRAGASADWIGMLSNFMFPVTCRRAGSTPRSRNRAPYASSCTQTSEKFARMGRTSGRTSPKRAADRSLIRPFTTTTGAPR